MQMICVREFAHDPKQLFESNSVLRNIHRAKYILLTSAGLKQVLCLEHSTSQPLTFFLLPRQSQVPAILLKYLSILCKRSCTAKRTPTSCLRDF